jgi:hypothetical protein
MRIRRRENRRRFRGKGTPPQRGSERFERNGSAAPAPTLSDVLREPGHDDGAILEAPRMIDRPLLTAWPAGYQNGGFRVVDVGVLLSARGMPTLFLREAEKLAAAAE